jgi:sucrose-phosphate synthase
MNLGDFDAFICSSGSEIYYTGSSNADNLTTAGDSTCTIDLDYVSHIDYRWGGEGLRRTMVRWAESVAKKGEKAECVVLEDKQRCNKHCLAFQIKDPTVVPTVEKLRKQLRMQGLRCHVIYCHKGSKLHVIPLLASRSQALRYLFTRWGMEVTNMFVFIGETGDTDYEELLGGLHKTVILKGTVDNGCENLLRSNSSYVKEDVVPLNSHNIGMAEEVYSVEDLHVALKKLGLAAV